MSRPPSSARPIPARQPGPSAAPSKALPPSVDPLEEAINRGPDRPRQEAQSEDFDQGADGRIPAGYAADLLRNGSLTDFPDSAQPGEEDGVSEDMSSLALNSGYADLAGLSSEERRQAGRATDGSQADNEVEADATPLHLTGDFAGLDDAAIMLELKAGNMTAFDFLIQKYRKPIVNFMYRMTRNQAIAEELAQEVFLRVFRSRETYRAEARFSTWLYRIATNLGVNQARDTRHERTASTVYLDQTDSETGTTPDVADSTPGAEARLLRDERMAAIRDHVMALPERQRMAVLMHKYEGMDYSQIGEVLKLSESATKSLLFRAYQTLREKLKGFV